MCNFRFQRDTFWQLACWLLLALLLFGGLGDIALLNFNEARRSVTVREMLLAHDWLIPLMNGEPYLTKPPLFYWLSLLLSQVSGSVNEWTLRLPSALFAALSGVLVYRLGTRLSGRRVGLLAALFTLANAGFSLHARSAEIEMTLASLCFASLFAADRFLFSLPPHRSGMSRRRDRVWLLSSYALLGAAVLAKGPVSFLFTVAPIAVFWLIERDRRAREYLGSVSGWLLALVIGGSWYFAVSLREGLGIWGTIISRDIADKVAGGASDPWYSYLVYLLGDFFPFWLILLFRPSLLWRQIRARAELRFIAVAALLPLLIFSCFSAKNPKYLLPVYPLLALLLALHWVQWLESVAGWRRRALVGIPAVTLAAYVLFYLVGAPNVLRHRVQALPQIRTVVEQSPDVPLYYLGQPDMRLVFYAGHPVTSVSAAQIASLPPSGLLFTTTPLDNPRACLKAQYQPYLSKRRELLVYQLDRQCDAAPAPLRVTAQ